MRKNLFMLLVFVLFQSALSAQSYVKARKGYIPKDNEFVIISESPKKEISLGELYSNKLMNTKELLSLRWSSPYGMNYQKKIYKGIEVDFNDSKLPDEMMVYIITIFDESWLTRRGGHIGMVKNEIIALYGEPSPDYKDFLCYYNDDYDELEIMFFFDSEDIIQRIIVCMGT